MAGTAEEAQCCRHSAVGTARKLHHTRTDNACSNAGTKSIPVPMGERIQTKRALFLCLVSACRGVQLPHQMRPFET